VARYRRLDFQLIIKTMKRFYKIIGQVAILLAVVLSSGCQKSNPIFENNSVYIELRKDLNGFKEIIDKKTRRNYASELDSCIYSLNFGNNYKDSIRITSSTASKRECIKVKDGLELHFVHDGGIPLNVVCKISSEEGSSLLKWSITVTNKSKRILCSIEYPTISCIPVLGNNPENDAVVFPLLEGSLLTGMSKAGASMESSYPGNISAQLMYYFDPDGGIYYAAYDGEGYAKTLKVSNSKGSIILSHKYFLPVEYQKEIELPYPVITGFSGGHWEDGAGIYREWAQKQKWCANTLSNKDTPQWLKKPNLFISVSYPSTGFESAAKSDIIIKKYHEFFDIPIIATGFGWEKNGIWIGPDYFPPVHGDKYYSDLATKVKERGDHLHVFTSGFRWGFKKPKSERKNETEFTDFNGLDLFMKYGKPLTVIDNKGELLMEKRPWAHNYFICPGSQQARAVFDSIFLHIYKWGFSGVDLDQNLGGHVDDCFSQSHGHPAGAGLWQYKAMNNFLSEVRKKAKLISEDNFIGVEEPCEIYIPQFDVFHGRSFTLTDWPVGGPGGVSIPLFDFIYHQYQIPYAGWLTGRAPFGNLKNAIGRAFIFGYYPGIGTTGKFDLRKTEVSDETKIIKGYIHLFKKYPEILINGKMISEIQIKGCDLTEIVNNGKTYPIKWQTVQGIAWSSDSKGEIAYTLANLSDKSQEIQMQLISKSGKTFELMGYELDKEVKQNMISDNDGWITLKLAPWQLSVVKQDGKTP
jgi:hypothetical protein